MTTDKVLLVFVGQSTQLVRAPVADGLGALWAVGPGWQKEMSLGAAQRLVDSRPDMFRIEVLGDEQELALSPG